MALMVHRDLKAHKDQQETMVLMAHKVLKVHKAQQELVVGIQMEMA